MRILKLHYPKRAHPYWDKDKYIIELPNGKMIDPVSRIAEIVVGYGYGLSYRLFWNRAGVWMRICACGSGYGRIDLKEFTPRLLVSSNLYDKIEFVGEKREMSDTLKQDLLENKITF